MITLFLTQQSDSELDAIVLSAEDNAENQGVTFASAKNFLPIGDVNLAIGGGTLLVSIVKLLFELHQKPVSDLTDNAIANLARERVQAECDRMEITDYHIDELKVLSTKGHKSISAVFSCEYFKARVLVDDLGNVTFTNLKL